MIEILGPAPGVDRISDQDLVHCYDYVDLDIISDLLRYKGRPRFVTGDHFLDVKHDLDIEYRGVLLWLEKQAEDWKNLDWPEKIQTRHCFNFMVNRKQYNRFLLIKLVQALGLQSYDYTWSGHGREFNLDRALKEFSEFGSTDLLTTQEKSVLLAPIELTSKFIDIPVDPGSPVSNVHVRPISPDTMNMPDNKWPWQHGLDQMFLQSAVSLISETGEFHHGTVYTEKTLYSVFGLTFPIWIGGYCQPHNWNKIGFDTFDDVIDHSYQDRPSLIERCVMAFKKNLKLLTDIDYAASMRMRCRDRLLANRERLLNGQLAQFNQSRIAQWPDELKEFVPAIISNLPKGALGPWVFRKCS
jgi:hypothetical protein